MKAEEEETTEETREQEDEEAQDDPDQHICYECDAEFASSELLERHLESHTGDTVHSCPECGEEFAHQGELDGHLRTHTTARPHVCPECGRTFTKVNYMNNHIRAMHGAESVAANLTRSYSCPACSKIFAQPKQLQQHLRSHMSPLPSRPTVSKESKPTTSPIPEAKLEVAKKILPASLFEKFAAGDILKEDDIAQTILKKQIEEQDDDDDDEEESPSAIDVFLKVNHGTKPAKAGKPGRKRKTVETEEGEVPVRPPVKRGRPPKAAASETGPATPKVKKPKKKKVPTATLR